MGKRPSFQFYPGDWMKDPAVRSVSVAARGLWTDMLCLMFESPRRGYLQHASGKLVTASQLARMTGCETDEVSRLLQELEDSAVFSRNEHGMIYSRRMVRDEHKRQLCTEAGKKGGNPTLNRHNKGHPKGGVKPNPTPSSSSSASSSDLQTSSEVCNTTEEPTDKGRKKFVKPTVREVREYCESRGNGVNPEQFVDFYESKGWKVGNQPMKDWQAAVRTWERTNGKYSNRGGPAANRVGPGQRYSGDAESAGKIGEL